MFRDGIPGEVLGELGKEGGGSAEFEAEGEVIDGCDADLGEVGNFSFVEFFCIFEEVEHLDEGGCGFGAEHAMVGEVEIVRCDGFAVGPFGVFAKFEGPNGFVLVVGPGFGCAAEVAFVFCRVVLDEAFKECAQDFAFGDAGDAMGVEAFGFGGVGEDEDVVVVGDLNLGSVFAGDEEGPEAETEKRFDEESHCGGKMRERRSGCTSFIRKVWDFLGVVGFRKGVLDFV